MKYIFNNFARLIIIVYQYWLPRSCRTTEDHNILYRVEKNHSFFRQYFKTKIAYGKLICPNEYEIMSKIKFGLWNIM